MRPSAARPWRQSFPHARRATFGPNCADRRRPVRTSPGHFTVATWKCGCCCNTVAVIDAISGEVRFAPFAFEDAFENGKIVCDRGSDYKIDSELFVVGGKVGDEVGRHYYRWHDRAFTRVYFEPGCS